MGTYAADGTGSDGFGCSISLAPGVTAGPLIVAVGACTKVPIDASVDVTPTVTPSPTSSATPTPQAQYGNVGQVDIFAMTLPSWTRLASVTRGAAAAAYDYFGSSLAFSNGAGVMLVGGPQINYDYGSTLPGFVDVFVLTNGTWLQQAELYASDGSAGDGFGTSCAINGAGTLAVVGTTALDEVYVFAYAAATANWTQVAIVTINSGGSGFGRALALSLDGLTLVIGAPQYGLAGQAFTFVRLNASDASIWTRQFPSLGPVSPNYGEAFGRPTGRSGQRLHRREQRAAHHVVELDV